MAHSSKWGKPDNENDSLKRSVAFVTGLLMAGVSYYTLHETSQTAATLISLAFICAGISAAIPSNNPTDTKTNEPTRSIC